MTSAEMASRPGAEWSALGIEEFSKRIQASLLAVDLVVPENQDFLVVKKRDDVFVCGFGRTHSDLFDGDLDRMDGVRMTMTCRGLVEEKMWDGWIDRKFGWLNIYAADSESVRELRYVLGKRSFRDSMMQLSTCFRKLKYRGVAVGLDPAGFAQRMENFKENDGVEKLFSGEDRAIVYDPEMVIVASGGLHDKAARKLGVRELRDLIIGEKIRNIDGDFLSVIDMRNSMDFGLISRSDLRQLSKLLVEAGEELALEVKYRDEKGNCGRASLGDLIEG